MNKSQLPPVRHFRKDGTEIKDIRGMKINKPHPVYDVMERMVRHEKAEQRNAEREDSQVLGNA